MKTVKILILVALVALATVPMVAAQTGKWNSSFSVINLGTDVATITVVFFDDAGNVYTPDVLDGSTPPTPNPFTLAAGYSQVIYVPGIPADQLPDGRYSVGLAADQPIAAIGNLIGEEAGPIYFNGSYSGANNGGQVNQYLPSVNKNYYTWNSHLSIQNLTGAAQDVTVNFYDGTPVSIETMTQTVAAYSSWHLDVGAVTGLPYDYNGSAVASAAGPIAAIDNQTSFDGFTQDYNGFSTGATILYCPGLYNHYYTWDSSLNVQNVGTTTATVNIAYSDGTTARQELGPNAAYLFYQPGEPGHADTFSAVVTSTEPVVAVVNAANPMNQAQTYNCFDEGATTFFAPIIEKHYFNWDSAIQVQNMSVTTATITITYEVTTCVSTYDIPAHGTQVIYQPVTCLPDGYAGSAMIVADQPILAIVNQTMGPGQTGDQGDWSMSYNAVAR